MPVRPLAANRLYTRCNPRELGFRTTRELESAEAVLGQERALEAIAFGADMRRAGYNIFALGAQGTGRHSVIREVLEARATGEPTPDDLCYINNFDNPRQPKALLLPPGRGAPLAADMRRLVEELRVAIPAAFESDDYRTRARLIEEELKESQEDAVGEIDKRARDQGITLLQTPAGFVFAPLKDDAVLTPKEFAALPTAEQERLRATIQELQETLQETLRGFPRRARDARERVRQLNREVTQLAVGHLIDELRRRWSDLDDVLAWLDAVQADVINRAQQFLQDATAARAQPIPDAAEAAPGEPGSGRGFHTCQVNVMVDNGATKGAPVVYEDHPTLPNLLGREEHMASYGTLVTDFTLLRPGALHRANGGYLILDARRLLMQPLSWEELKRILRAREIRIESPGEALGLVSTVSLDPEAVPLDIKVILIGDRRLYYLLCALDPDFESLFKVPADFDDRIPRTEATVAAYARQIATLARREETLALDRGAVARVVEHGSRLAGDSERMTIRLGVLADLLREADHYAREEGRRTIGAGHIRRAIEGGRRRAGRMREQVLEEIDRGTVLIDTDGGQCGQINGLSVIQLDRFSFGRPTRITARVRPGRGEVIDIERQVELGGPLHSKGVLILSGYLGERFGTMRPLSLSASLVFEQSYGGVDGDSASSTELYALLSALSGFPIRQSLAVTGSVNQHGRVQAIGGVNEKIEGFFDVCAARGLTGKQGVLIPESNIRHLMLRADVVKAARSKQFHVWPVATIDEGLEILTGVPAGIADAEGRFPPDSVNGRVAAKLDEFIRTIRRHSGRLDGNRNRNDDDDSSN